MSETSDALAGVKVIEFGGYAAGPHVGKVLANFGATVVHVESARRPDGFRLEYPPFKDGRPGVNRGGCFAFFNDSKLDVTLDLKNEAGLDLARRLIDWSDIVVENMRPGVMARLGLGFEAASAAHPALIMLSTCNMGQTGPRARTPGFGSQLSSLAGFCGVAGERRGSPMLLYGPYIDFIASTMATSAVLAALDHRRRTGKGAWLDVSQYETGLHFMAGALLDYHDTGTVAERRGNEDREAAPHGAYRCADGRWIAVSCWSDGEFRALAGVLGFAVADNRRDCPGELDQTLRACFETRDAEDVVAKLQERGVAAHVVNTVGDLFDDPQLAERKVWRTRNHQEIGDQTYCLPGFELSETPGKVTRPAPLLGADNETVFKEFLGMSDDDFEDYKDRSAFE
jgi:crotonobetainyl-CoA:carnitine CoA-transferase CaiB-like acyl-CoA transferase